MTIHPTAIIDPSADLDSHVEVGAYAVIGPRVVIGAGSVIEHHVCIARDTTLGRDNHVRPFAALGGDPQDLKYAGERTRLCVGDRNRIGEYVTMHRGTALGQSETLVGDDGLFMAHAHVAHDCRVGNQVIFANAATLAGHVHVADLATIGAYSGVHQFCRVGRHAFIGGYSVVTLDALPFTKTVGNRARAFGINATGLRRNGFSAEAIRELKASYRELFRCHQTLAVALGSVAERYAHNAHVAELLSFIRETKRGICR